MKKRNYSFNNIFIGPKLSFILTLALFIVLGIILLKYYQYQINLDGINYIMISKEYINGNYVNAINSYWSPLLSWLLVPFIYFNQSPAATIFSIKIFSLIVGIFTIIGIRKLSYKFEMNEKIRSILLFSLVPIILYFAYSVITPDLLLVCILVFYFNIIFSSKYSEKLYNGLFCGILGAMAYLTKSFAFPFFIAHFSIFNMIYYINISNKRAKILKNLLIGFLAFFIISSAWIGIISDKEGKITYGTSGEYNYAIVGPDAPNIDVFYLDEKLNVQPWSPFKSWKNFIHQLHLIFMNLIKSFNILESFSYFSFIILIIYLLFFIKPIRSTLKDFRFYPFISILIIIGGYLLVVVEERYLWIVYILLLLMSGYVLNYLSKFKFFYNKKNILLIIVIVSFIILPVTYLNDNLNAQKEAYLISLQLKEYNVTGTWVSDDNYSELLFISYYSNSSYKGLVKPGISDIQLNSLLKRYNVDYYFVYGNNNSSFLSNYKEITNGKINGLKIYNIKDYSL